MIKWILALIVIAAVVAAAFVFTSTSPRGRNLASDALLDGDFERAADIVKKSTQAEIEEQKKRAAKSAKEAASKAIDKATESLKESAEKIVEDSMEGVKKSAGDAVDKALNVNDGPKNPDKK